MASLRKLPNCRNWIACFNTVNGKRKQRSTGTQDRKEALKIADTFESAAKRRKTARQVQRVIADMYTELTGDGLPSSTVRAFIGEWLDRKDPELSAATRRHYHAKSALLLDFLCEKADWEMSRITQADLVAFRNREVSRVSPSSANHAAKFVRMVFLAAKREGVMVENPAEFLGNVASRERSARRAFTLDELRLLLAHATPEWQSMILFGLYTGQRLGDIALLTWQNIDTDAGEIRLQTVKTGRQQILPIASPLARHIGVLPAHSDPGQPIHPRAHEIVSREGRVGTLSRQFYEIMTGAGLVPKRSHHTQGDGRAARRSTSDISFHALRHTATSLMKNAGISPAIVQEFIGHDSPAVSRVYTHIETKSMRRAANVLPDLVRKGQ